MKSTLLIAALVALFVALVSGSAMACDDGAIRDQNRLIREQIRQGERQERIERDRSRMIDRAIRNKDR